MAVQKQDDQHEHTFSSYVRIRVAVLKTYLGRWTIGRSGERGSGISVLPARDDDDDDVLFRSILYINFLNLFSGLVQFLSHTCIHVNKYGLNYLNTHTHTHTYTHACTHTHTHARTHTHTHAHIHIYIYIYISCFFSRIKHKISCWSVIFLNRSCFFYVFNSYVSYLIDICFSYIFPEHHRIYLLVFPW